MRFYASKKQFYCGVDLHSKDFYICILDSDRKKLVHRKFRKCKPEAFLRVLKPYKHDIVVAAESCYAWYWLADLCEENGIEFILGHALYMKAIHGGKAKNDRIDSYKIALLAQGGMFPLAYVYPREKRALRDLLRRRLTFVRLRSDLLAHLHLLNYQENDKPLGRMANRKSTRVGVPEQFDNLEVRKSAEANLQMIGYYDEVIKDMEQHIMAKARKHYQKELSILMSIRGIGKTIALTLLFEMDRVDRFPSHREFASYGRLIKCTHESAGKKYGTGGAKIGNPYLKYAFSEAATHVALFNPRIEKFLKKLESKHGKGKALSILAHKIGRAVYHMLKNETVFAENRFLKR